MERLAWHSLSPLDVAHALSTDLTQGLSSQEAHTRLLKNGRNHLEKPKAFRVFRIIARQLASPLALVLIVAFLVTMALREIADAVVVLVALSMNTLLGVYQEGRASRVFDELSRSAQSFATVVRDALPRTIPAEEVVEGDIVQLAGGKTVPADTRLFEVHDLALNEAAFTGEWLPVKKGVEADARERRVVEQSNMAWGGTLVAEGAGKGIVVATGAHSAFGHLARSVSTVDESETPLTGSVRRLALTLSKGIVAVIALIITIGFLRDLPFSETLLVAVAVAVSAMPEGLPAAISVVLAVAMEAVLRNKGLVKSLLAAETLGSTTIILTDKTGTLTKGEMAIVGVHSARGIRAGDGSPDFRDNADVVRAAVYASDAYLEQEGGVFVARGRPVERAIVEMGRTIGCTQEGDKSAGFERTDFMQFESSRRYAGSLNRERDGTYRVYLSGAPETLLALSSKYATAGGSRPLDNDTRALFAEAQRAGSAEGKRFIGVAYVQAEEGRIPDAVRRGEHRALVFLGFLSLADAVRADVHAEITAARNAGTRVVMLTGDFPETARAVAAEAGIATKEEMRVVSGTELDDMSDQELCTKFASTQVFARVAPDQKLRIVKLLRARGEVVAMTGDGINDAPALMAADIGVAVGSGTDVAKAASDMILVEDSFRTIIAAIREGRRAVENVRRIVLYLLSTSMSAVALVVGTVAVGMPLPLLPTQLLWTNIIQEGFMSIPFAFEPASARAMSERPRGRGEAILTRSFVIVIASVSLIGTLSLFFFYLTLMAHGVALEVVRSALFAALSLLALSYAFSLKDLAQPLWRIPLWGNHALLFGLAASLATLALSFVLPPLRSLLSLELLPPLIIAWVLALSAANVCAVECAKALARRVAR